MMVTGAFYELRPGYNAKWVHYTMRGISDCKVCVILSNGTLALGKQNTTISKKCSVV